MFPEKAGKAGKAGFYNEKVVLPCMPLEKAGKAGKAGFYSKKLVYHACLLQKLEKLVLTMYVVFIATLKQISKFTNLQLPAPTVTQQE